MDLKLLSRLRPVAEAETSVGRIYLYPLRVKDMIDFEKLDPAEVINQVRNFLTSIGSLTLESDEAPDRIPLDPVITNTLSEDEVEQLAEAYVQSSEWQKVREGSQERKPVAREEGETASAYLIRLVKDKVEQHHQATKQWNEKMLGISHGLFDQVRKSTSALGSTLSEFEKLTKPLGVTPLDHPLVQTSLMLDPQLVQSSVMTEFQADMAQQASARAAERAEEMELTRLTGQMTAESAKALKDLVDAATIMMEEMNKRDIKNDQSARGQLKVALVAVIVSAILSGLSLVQDWRNNEAGDQWQVKVLTAIEQENQQRSALERENQALLAQVKFQGARIAELGATQRTTAKSMGPSRSPAKPNRAGH